VPGQAAGAADHVALVGGDDQRRLHGETGMRRPGCGS
jgi:hypothetical protein